MAIGNALSVVGDDSVLDALEDIVLDSGYGKDREMVAVALARMNDRERALSTLLRAADDPQIVGHVLWALRLIADPRTSKVFWQHLDHAVPWIRKQARRGLEKTEGKKTD